jgi:hypothetical protein
LSQEDLDPKSLVSIAASWTVEGRRNHFFRT